MICIQSISYYSIFYSYSGDKASSIASWTLAYED